MLYIRKLEIIDEQDNIILKLKGCKADKGIRTALKVIEAKEGNKTFKDSLQKYFRQLDEDFINYFGFRVVKK